MSNENDKRPTASTLAPADHIPDATKMVEASTLGAGDGGEHREFLGKMVRMEWEAWAREQPNPKASWLTPWAELTEPEREVDRRIGQRIHDMAIGSIYEPLSASAQPRGAIRCYVGETKESCDAGPKYWVTIERDGKTITPYHTFIRGRAEYEVAEWDHLLNGAPEPDILAYETDAPTATPSSADLAGEGRVGELEDALRRAIDIAKDLQQKVDAITLHRDEQSVAHHAEMRLLRQDRDNWKERAALSPPPRTSGVTDAEVEVPLLWITKQQAESLASLKPGDWPRLGNFVSHKAVTEGYTVPLYVAAAGARDGGTGG